MILLNSVLVAFDFSDTSSTALMYGQNLATAFGGRLYVLHVADVVAPTAEQFFPDGPGDPVAKATTKALERLRSFLASSPAGPLARPAIRLSHSPADAIMKYAKDVRADVIVVGTHGRSGVSRLLMGSVAEHVVRNAPCPVLVVRPRDHDFVVPGDITTATRI